MTTSRKIRRTLIAAAATAGAVAASQATSLMVASNLLFF